MARGAIPAITWGAAFANTLNTGVPLDRARAYSQPRKGSRVHESAGGVRDSWIVGRDQVLEGLWRWIPITDEASPTVTGWDGATGWRAALEWMQDSNVFRFMPDQDSMGTFLTMYLLEPFDRVPIDQERIFRYRSLFLSMRTSDDAVVTGY